MNEPNSQLWLHRQFLRDRQSGEYLSCRGVWTYDERDALNLSSVCQMIHFRLAHATRDLELVMKEPGEPDHCIRLPVEELAQY